MSQDKIGRNDPCPCGSGLKQKKCHGDKTIEAKVRMMMRLTHLALIMDRKIDTMFKPDQDNEKHAERQTALKTLVEQLESILPKDLVAALRGEFKERLVIPKVERCIKCSTRLDGQGKCHNCK